MAKRTLYRGLRLAFGSDGVFWKYIFSGNVLGMSEMKTSFDRLIPQYSAGTPKITQTTCCNESFFRPRACVT